MIAYAYWTPKYEPVAQDYLLTSADVVDLRCERVSSLGGWCENVLRAPTLIRRAMDRFQEPLYWIGADSVIHKPLREWDADVGFFLHPMAGGLEPEPYNGTVFLNATDGARTFVEMWELLCRVPLPGEGNMPSFSRAVKALTGLISFQHLPVEYHAINGFLDVDDPVIAHETASSWMKAVV